MDIKTWLLSFLLPLIVGFTPIYMWFLQQRKRTKEVLVEENNNKGRLNIENFNALLKANKDLREELETDKRELLLENKLLREDIDQEKAKTGEMAKQIIVHNNRIEEVMKIEESCQEHLENAMLKIEEYKKQLKDRL